MEVRSIETIFKALNDAGVKYLVVGGLAVNAHGFQRFTMDVDLVIGLAPENITRGLYALRAAGYQASIPVSPEQFADREQREMWRREKNMLVLKLWSDLHRRTPVDVFVYEPFDFDAEYVLARPEVVMGTIHAPVVSYQTLLAMKKEAGREKDLQDIEALKKLDRYR
jgi:predicted nucleotidyltransferase